MKTTLTINPFNLKVYSLKPDNKVLQEFPDIKIESFSTTSGELRIKFARGYPFGVQFVKGSDIESRKVLNFEHLEKRVSFLIVDASANRDKVFRLLLSNEVDFIERDARERIIKNIL